MLGRGPLALVTASTAASAMRLGGEWAGWRAAFRASSGSLITSDIERYCSDTMVEWGQVPAAFEECTTESQSDDRIARRTVRLLPEDGCNIEDLAAVISRADITPVARGSTLAVDTVADGLWRCETIFDGLGGARPRDRVNALPGLAERTRVSVVYDAAAGKLAQSVVIWQERQWAADAGALSVREGGSRCGIDGAWLSSAIGLSCFAEANSAAASDASPAPPDGFALALPGGVEVRGDSGMLEVSLDAPGTSRVCLRRAAFDESKGACTTELRDVAS